MASTNICNTTGRRKTSSARVFLRPGKGSVTVNGKSLNDYFSRETAKVIASQPLVVTGSPQYDYVVTVTGGGISGQAGAIRLGIARALAKESSDHKVALRKAGLLTRDSREVERKKVGLHKARKGTQYSKR